ncbi:MAG: Ku protein [Steroidobacteraceae bacterium]
MAARSSASLTISFGLVAIPVKLYAATIGSARLRFHLLHAQDGSRLKQQHVCVAEQEVVGRDEIVKGYEFAKDQYVMFTPEELKALEEAGSHSVDVAEFVPLAAVDPVYFDTAYYLAPDQGGAKPFTLFATALRRGALGESWPGSRRHPPARRQRARVASAAFRARSAVGRGARGREHEGARGGAQARPAAHRAAERR